MLLRRRKLLWSLGKMLWSSRRTQPPVDCLWSLVSSFPGLSVNSDNLPFSSVILFLLFTYVNYMHENWSWHAYRFALGFLWKKRCDRYQQALRRYQARKIRRRDFDEGDLVLRLRHDNRGRHKLSPPWEGPYVVVKVLKIGTYKLANEDGEELTNAWNIQQLHCFYP
jgi:hypothetical protein